MNKQRLRAFTIMEVTISMMVTALLIGITYTSYLIISGSYLSFNRKNEKLAELNQLDQLMRKDFVTAEFIAADTSGIILKKDSTTIRYRFSPDYILRKATRIDTFKFNNLERAESFEGKFLDQSGTSLENNQLDDLTFSILFDKEKISYHYHKQYSSADLITRNPNALH